MRTRVKKHKLGSTKPASQLFLFSNKLNKNIDTYFSGNVILEIELSSYDYKYHDEAKKVVEFMENHCKSSSIKPYKFMTVIVNYKANGLTLANLSGDYNYPIAIHGSLGYKQLDTIHSAYEALIYSLLIFQSYKECSLSYALSARLDPINLSERMCVSLEKTLTKTEQNIHKSISLVLTKFHKNFRPAFRK